MDHDFVAPYKEIKLKKMLIGQSVVYVADYKDQRENVDLPVNSTMVEDKEEFLDFIWDLLDEVEVEE